jgi:hypothetical protein
VDHGQEARPLEDIDVELNLPIIARCATRLGTREDGIEPFRMEVE